jgi:hypothetical protein
VDVYSQIADSDNESPNNCIVFDANVPTPCLRMASAGTVVGLNVFGNTAGGPVVLVYGSSQHQDIHMYVRNLNTGTGSVCMTAQLFRTGAIRLKAVNGTVRTTQGTNGTVGLSLVDCTRVSASVHAMFCETAVQLTSCDAVEISNTYAWYCKRVIDVGANCRNLRTSSVDCNSFTSFTVNSPNAPVPFDTTIYMSGDLGNPGVSTIENLNLTDATYGGMGVRLTGGPEFRVKPSNTVMATTAVPATGVWARNKWRSPVPIKFLTGSGITSIKLRDYDALAYTVEVATSLPSELGTRGCNEEIQITYTGTVSWFFVGRA